MSLGFSCETLVATASHKVTQLLVVGSQNNSEKTILAPGFCAFKPAHPPDKEPVWSDSYRNLVIIALCMKGGKKHENLTC